MSWQRGLKWFSQPSSVGKVARFATAGGLADGVAGPDFVGQHWEVVRVRWIPAAVEPLRASEKLVGRLQRILGKARDDVATTVSAGESDPFHLVGCRVGGGCHRTAVGTSCGNGVAVARTCDGVARHHVYSFAPGETSGGLAVAFCRRCAGGDGGCCGDHHLRLGAGRCNVRVVSARRGRQLKTDMVLLIDNYDSFVHNLARYFERLGQRTLVLRNDAVTSRDIVELNPAAIVLSPGPCTPDEAGNSLQIVRELSERFPMLGVCLGHQTIAAAWGAQIVRAPEPMHGRTSRVQHRASGLFQGLPNPTVACRYHSLVVDEATLPDVLEVTARTEDNVIMALQHRQLPIWGVQFHPEAILTEKGFPILANFLQLAGLPVDTRPLDRDGERCLPEKSPSVIPEAISF